MNADRTINRRVLLGGGLASAVALGAAACSAPGNSIPSPPAARTTRPSTAQTRTPAATPTSTTDHTTTDHTTPAALRTPGPDIQHGPRTRHAVALTFHGAGDPALTHEVLRVCAEHHARLTVFAVGTWLTAHPDLGRAIVAAGHDLGNHTWSHQPMLHLDRQAADAEIRDGARAVAAIKGSSPLLFRPSGTPASTPLLRSAARAAGYARCVSYDVDPMDYQDPGATTVARRTLAAVRAGSIVSLHLGHRGTVQALPTILAGLTERGLTPVTMTELLA